MGGEMRSSRKYLPSPLFQTMGGRGRCSAYLHSGPDLANCSWTLCLKEVTQGQYRRLQILSFLEGKILGTLLWQTLFTSHRVLIETASLQQWQKAKERYVEHQFVSICIRWTKDVADRKHKGEPNPNRWLSYSYFILLSLHWIYWINFTLIQKAIT